MKLIKTDLYSLDVLFIGNDEYSVSLFGAVSDSAMTGLYLIEVRTPVNYRALLGLEHIDTAGIVLHLLWMRIYLQPRKRREIHHWIQKELKKKK